MNQTRTLLLIAWLVVGYFLWEAWQRDYASPDVDADAPTQLADGTTGDAAIPGDDVPSASRVPDAPAASDAPAAPVAADAATDGEPVVVTTDVLRVEIARNGGSVVEARLLDYGTQADDDSPRVTLLDDDATRYFVAQTGLVSATDTAPSHTDAFTPAADSYTLTPGTDTVEVPFEWRGDGLVVRRIYVFERGDYDVAVRYEIENTGSQAWQGNIYRQLQRVPPPTPSRSFFASPEAFAFTGGAWYSPEDNFQKLAFDEFEEEPVDRTVRGGWTAMLQHYFVTAWIPPAQEAARIESAVRPGSRYVMRDIGSTIEVAPGASAENVSHLYVGPKLQDHLSEVAPGLELSVDYGVLTILAQPLFWLLSLLHDLFGNWGWAIIGLVVIIKLAFFKLSETQYKSFAKMRRVQPRIEALKERYGDDRQKFQMAMMELYKKEKINPMGGCLPILVQIPVFIALYWVLVESVELRHAPWILWIDNLTARDPYFVLPAINMLAMWATQKLSPAPGMDPIQKRMLQAMPFVFGVMFAFFPAGLVLYWATNGVLGLAQQWVIMRRHGVSPLPAKS